MKTNIVMFAALIAMGHSAMAQTSSTTIAAPAAATNAAAATTANTNTATADATNGASKIGVSYLGIMYGPGLSNELDGKTKDGRDLWLNNRPAVTYKFDENTRVGVQARFNVRFMKDGMDAVLDNSRLFANFNNVYKDDVFSLNLVPRVVIPGSAKAHERGLLPSPEFMPIFSINPKDSRLSLSVYPQAIQHFYSNNTANNDAGAPATYVCGNIEGTYQVSPAAQITFGFYPEYVSEKGRAMYNSSNELDLGMSFDVAKGWSVNPFVATEFIGMGADNAAISKNMNLMLVVSGAVL